MPYAANVLTEKEAFATKYLVMFTEPSDLSKTVELCAGRYMPLRVRYSIGEHGYLDYYLAGKLGEGENEEETMERRKRQVEDEDGEEGESKKVKLE